MDPSSVRVYRDGTVSYARRMNFDVACDMDFRLFPFDNQTCDIIMHSFAYTTDDYTLRWTRNDDGEVTSYVNDVINLAQWTFELSFDGEYDMEEIGNEVKPGLIARLTLQRLPYYHILMFYLPAFFFAIVAYLTSFIPPVFGIGLRSNVNIVVLLSVFALNNAPSLLCHLHRHLDVRLLHRRLLCPLRAQSPLFFDVHEQGCGLRQDH